MHMPILSSPLDHSKLIFPITKIQIPLSLQDIVIETMLGRKNSVQGPLMLNILFVGLKTMSPSVTAKHSAHCNIHCVPFKVSIMCLHHFSIR